MYLEGEYCKNKNNTDTVYRYPYEKSNWVMESGIFSSSSSSTPNSHSI